MLNLCLERILRFLNASFLLSQLGDTAHLKCSKSMFSLIVSRTSPPDFNAALRIAPPFFASYMLLDSLTYNWKISLKLLCDNLRDAMICPSIIFTVFDENPPRALLTSLDSSIDTSGPRVFYREMVLSHPVNQEDEEDINYATFVSIDSQEFKHILMEFLDIYLVDVSVTNLQVKFSNAFKEIILTTTEGRCIIEGIEAGKEIQFLITLRPTTFFHDLTSQAERVWLYRTTKARGVIIVPIDSNVQFEIYFL